LTKDELIKQLSTILGKTKVNKLVVLLEEQVFALRDLIDLTFHEDKTIAFRAAWLLENLFLAEPLAYVSDLDYLLKRFKDIKYHSCQRHYAKIMMHITSPKAPAGIKEKLDTVNLKPIVEQCFDWMIDPKVLIAVKVFSAEALFNLRDRHPWISGELSDQLKFLMKDGSAAIQSRGRKLLAGLNI